ncbi:MAG: aldo/keto reductase [Euryarchaeota archaeon]|nr:aldo/keto reductase [Euryarchaeota archaeon]
MSLQTDSRVRLNNGVEMPLLGLGVWQMHGKECERAVRLALEQGYRLIDTASMYGNEREVGLAVRESGVPREDVFVTTKVWNTEQGYESTVHACEASLKRLGMAYVDLYLIHWPVAGKRLATWQALVRLQAQGKCRAIGVSNYTVRHLEELRNTDPHVPAVNQFELSPFLYPRDLVRYCQERAIQVEAYSPLTRGRRLKDPRLVRIAAKYRKTAAQVLIRWGLEHGFLEIPKSSRPERIRENADVFDFALAPEDLGVLDALGEGLHVAWDPTDAP